jgi:hypothetical protein
MKSRHVWKRRIAALGAAGVALSAGFSATPAAAAAAAGTGSALDYAVFSASASSAPNLANQITGNVYSNYTGSFTSGGSSVVDGNLDFAGPLLVNGAARISGTVRAGGSITMENAGYIKGNALSGGKVSTSITGDWTTRIAGDACGATTAIGVRSQVAGSVTAKAGCDDSRPNLSLPQFTYNAAQWPGTTNQAKIKTPAPNAWSNPTWDLTPAAGAWTGNCTQFLDMLDYNKAARWSNLPLITLSGTYRITGNCDVKLFNQQELWVAGKTALIMDGGFSMAASSKVVDKGNASLYLISTGGGNITLCESGTLANVPTFVYTGGTFSQTGSSVPTRGQVFANQVLMSDYRAWNYQAMAPAGLSGAGIADTSVKPTLTCVAKNNDGSWLAVWGYNNPNASTVSIPAGAQNQMTPAYTTAQPTSFAPGASTAAWSTKYADGTSPAWTLDGNTAAVTAGAATCPSTVVPMIGGSTLAQVGFGTAFVALIAGMWLFGMGKRRNATRTGA